MFPNRTRPLFLGAHIEYNLLILELEFNSNIEFEYNRASFGPEAACAFVLRAPCSVLFVPISMLRALCPVLCAPHSVLSAPCFVLRPLWPSRTHYKTQRGRRVAGALAEGVINQATRVAVGAVIEFITIEYRIRYQIRVRI